MPCELTSGRLRVQALFEINMYSHFVMEEWFGPSRNTFPRETTMRTAPTPPSSTCDGPGTSISVCSVSTEPGFKTQMLVRTNPVFILYWEYCTNLRVRLAFS